MNNTYLKDPSAIKFSKKYTEFNPMNNSVEYASTFRSIEKIGQEDPILIVDGECVDGRNRVKICLELGIQVLCIDVSNKMKSEDIILLCNRGLMSGRTFDVSQRAIQALKFVLEYNYTAVDAGVLWQVDKRVITYASTVKGFGREDILNDLLNGVSVQLENMDRPSKSLEVLCRQLKKLGERNVVEDTSERIKWDPEALIKTEHGKVWFYEKAERIPTIKITHELIADYIELANYKFKNNGATE